MAFSFGTRMRLKTYVIDGGPDHPCEVFLEETTFPELGHARRHPTVSYGKMTEPIDMPFR